LRYGVSITITEEDSGNKSIYFFSSKLLKKSWVLAAEEAEDVPAVRMEEIRRALLLVATPAACAGGLAAEVVVLP
jgi:hypothetical protein